MRTKDGHALDRTHRLKVNKFTDVEKYAETPEKYEEPEIEPYVKSVSLVQLRL